MNFADRRHEMQVKYLLRDSRISHEMKHYIDCNTGYRLLTLVSIHHIFYIPCPPEIKNHEFQIIPVYCDKYGGMTISVPSHLQDVGVADIT